MNKVYVTWQQVKNYIDNVAKFIESEQMKCSGIYGVPRGGLVLATMLSYRLNKPLLQAPAKDCIIIDDIADTGKSLCHYTDTETNFNKYFITTMFYAEYNSCVAPDLCESIKHPDSWIVFPWEYDFGGDYT